MSTKPIISIIGRPNVGKSSLFNRIIGKRLAVVDDQPGVTRDRNYFVSEWNGREIMLVDTGGMLPTDRDALPEAIHEQVRIAIGESSVVLFLVDATTGPTDTDLQIAHIIKRADPGKTICVVNKAESQSRLFELDSFRSLGLGNVFPVSAQHGSGVADVLDRAMEIIDARHGNSVPDTLSADTIHSLAIVGRPNAGKSSLVNLLLGKKRMIVDDRPGTTRDAIDSTMSWQGNRIVLIDTAGLRKKSHVKEDMEYYANLRALESIERCDVAVCMIDAVSGIGVQDLRIITKIIEMRKGILLVWNKWDLMTKDHRTFDQLVAQSRKQYKELQQIPMVAISAITGQRATKIIEKAVEIKERLVSRIGASEFEDRFFSWVRIHPHPAIPENPVRFLGAKQVTAPFPLFRVFTTNPKGIVPSYRRFLVNKIFETFDFEGCPVVLEFRPVKKGSKGPDGSQGTKT